MARLRFPGRPGQRIGKNYVKYMYDDIKIPSETILPAHNKIEAGLKLFHELFGYSDEEEEFDGFSSQDITEAKNALASSIARRIAVQRYLSSKNDPPSGASDVEKFLSTSTDSDASSSSFRQRRGMRDILRKSYDKMLKEGFSKSNIHFNTQNEEEHNLNSNKSNDHITDQFHKKNSLKNNKVENVKTNLNSDCNTKENNLDSAPDLSKNKSIVKRILERVKKKSESKGRRRKDLRSHVKKKFKSKFSYPTRKYTHLKNRLSPKTDHKNVIQNQTLKKYKDLMLPQLLVSEENQPSCSKLKNDKVQPKLRSKRQNSRKFVLPSRSIRSSRKIIPRRRYMDDANNIDRKDDEESQCSRSSFSGNSETTSAMDGGSSPEDSHCEDNVDSSYLQKKIGLLDRPLVVEGKRPWKPSLKVQMKLSDMNCEYPFALKKSGDESSGTNTSSGSFKDIIKPDMVSKYAEKMAQKPKEKSLKISVENTKKNMHSIKNEEAHTLNVSVAMPGRKKPEDKLEKVAAKIEKLLKSQWEGRLKETSTKLNKTNASKNKISKNVCGTLETAVAQWKSEQQQRCSSQRRTKSIIRKAKLHLEKKNLNLRTRKTVKESSQVSSLINNKKQKVETKTVATAKTDVSSPVNSAKVPSKDISSSIDKSVLTDAVGCVICGYSKLFTKAQTLYEQVACGACNKYFEAFVKSPKQYFCTKDGNCCIDSSKEASRKSVSTRCKACWLKNCLEKFTVSSSLKAQLLNYIPRLDTPPHNPLLLESENLGEEPEYLEELKVEGGVRGPRIKHVCRRAAVVLGLPRATFPEKVESKEAFNLSALPQEEKQKILETVPLPEETTTASETVAAVVESKPVKNKKDQSKKKTCKPLKLKNHVHLDVLKQSSLLIQKEQKRRRLLMKKSMKHLHKHSFKKSLKLGKRNQLKKTLKFSYKSAVKTTSVKSTQRMTQYARTKKMRKVRCKQCEGCLADDCGKCAYCLDKKKFGGPDTIKQACMYRRCLKPAFPASERKVAKPSKSDSPSKLSSDYVNFRGDGPSGLGLSLTSSSSSPTSPDNSSCNSSCSSSTTSSSSASSESSSSSSSGSCSSSTSSSSSDNISISHNSTVREGSIKTPFLHSAPFGSAVCQKKENSDINVNTSSVLNASFLDEECENESDYQDLTPCALVEPCETKMLNGSVVHNENGDTILYENSSSMIQLKNASYAPSLMYSAAYGENEDTIPYNSGSGGWKNTNSKNSYRQSQFNQNWDQYGSAGSGDQESNEDDEDSNKEKDDNSKKKHYIYADYWEDYDFERISSQGFALISSQQVPLPCACYLCGSYGEERLIFCVLCCEPYHTFCLPEQDVPHEENIENWCCKRCQSCAVCGIKNNLLKCKKCQNTYHSNCLTPHYPTKLSKKKQIWMCPKCVKCKSCGTSSPQSGGGPLWNFDLLLCQCCAKLTDKGNYCPVCHKCYEENDYESEMVQCYECLRWVHAKCDNISDEGYEILSCLPESVVYTCIECCSEDVPTWRKAIKEYLKHGLRNILNTLMSSRCASEILNFEKPVKTPDYMIEKNLGDQSTSLKSDAKLLSSIEADDDKSNCDSKENTESTDSSDVRSTLTALVSSVDDVSTCMKNMLMHCEENEANEKGSSSLKTDGSIAQKSLKSKGSLRDLTAIKFKLHKGRYLNIASFIEDILSVLENIDASRKHKAKAILTKQTEKIFPWFKIPTTKIWTERRDFPEGMLPNAVIPPYADHTYAQYLERADTFPRIKVEVLIDSRTCILCSYTGDSKPKKCGRLIYCGQNDWIHVNCALWSAEVFQQQDGSLRNVYPAVSRGKLMYCEFCNQTGATVGCCVRGCPANYHYYCARKDEAVLQEDRKIFCALHKDSVDDRVVGDDDFVVQEKVFVNQTSITPKWVKKEWQEPMDKDAVKIIIGSLTVTNLGYLSAQSNGPNLLIPINYECTRLFWSTRNPRIRVRYRCRIVEIPADKKPVVLVPNTTTIHTFGALSDNNNKLDTVSIKAEITDINDFQFNMEKQVNIPLQNSFFNREKDYHIVKKLLRNIVKKVAKRERKLAKYQEYKVFSKNNTSTTILSHNPEKKPIKINGCRKNCQINEDIVENKLFFDFDCDFSVNKDAQLSKNKVKNNYSEANDPSAPHNNNYLDYFASLYNLHSKGNFLTKVPFKYHTFVHDSKRKNDYKSFKKINNNSLDESLEDKDEIVRKNCAKEKYEYMRQHCEDFNLMPTQKRAFLDSISPAENIQETVLPVYSVEVKDRSAYGSNDDSHLRPSNKPQGSAELNYNRNKKDNSLPQNFDRSGSEGINKDINSRGEGNFNNSSNGKPFCNLSNGNSSDSNLGLKSGSHRNSPTVNGVGHPVVPFKCNKCKRIYRTNESFKKHIETCDFVVDSSSDEESVSSEEDNKQFRIHKPTSSFNESISNGNFSNCSKVSSNPIADPLTISNRKENVFETLNNNNSPTLPSKSFSCDIDVSSNNIAVSASKSKTLPITNESYNNSIQSKFSNATCKNKSVVEAVNHEVQHKKAVQRNRIISAPRSQNEILSMNTEQNCLNSQNMGSNLSHYNTPMHQEGHSQSFNCDFLNTPICNSPGPSMMQVPSNTLIIPPTHNSIAHSTSMFSQVTVPENEFLSSIEINQSSQLSYVGSITISNNEAMSLTVNVPDQVIPIYPQDMNYGFIQNSIQLQPTSEFHISNVNMQQISLQNTYQTNSLNQIVIPTQTMNMPQNQVVFVEETIAQQVAPQPPSNYILQIPPQNCSFNTYVSPSEYHPQFVSQVPFEVESNITPDSSTNMYQQQALLPHTNQSELPNVKLTSTPQDCFQDFNNHSIDEKRNVINPTPEPPTLTRMVSPDFTRTKASVPTSSTTAEVSDSTSFTTAEASASVASDFSNRSTPAPKKSDSNTSKSSTSLITTNNNIMNILKKAAEQMLSISAEKTKPPANDPGEKTRFAHTRKVAARKAEKLKKRNPIYNGKVSTPNKPKSIQFNIAALKQAFMPFLVASAAKDEKSPVPLQTDAPRPLPEQSVTRPLPEPLPIQKETVTKEPKPPTPVPEVALFSHKDEESDVYSYAEDSDEDSPLLKMHLQEMKRKDTKPESPPDKPYLMYEITSEDGFHITSTSAREAWEKVYEELQDARIAAHLNHKTVAPEDINGFHMLGLDNVALMYLLEQLPGTEQCPDYEFLFHPPSKDSFELQKNPTGSARSEPFNLRRDYDMFNFLASEHRIRPVFVPPEEEDEGAQKYSRRATNFDTPIAMRFRSLKNIAKETVGVYRSSIHGRGLFCKRNVDPGELVIEYAGEVIRSVLTDKRERIYQSKGIGCYMFRIDDDEVVDATMHGNAARFINHSCEPNCFSKVITVDGKKHIVIFALRKIVKGEELTYDYKFPFEEENKIPCHCNSRRCRKYLN